jgi:hypothetical protein
MRLVTAATHLKDPRWSKRIEFRNQMTFLKDPGCLYKSNELARRLAELTWEKNESKYDEPTDILNVGVEGPESLDAIDVFCTQNSCDCPIGHGKRFEVPGWFPNISKMDLAAEIAIVDSARST